MKLCIVFPEPESYSQTFIHAHINNLPASVITWNIIPRYNGAHLSKIFRLPKRPVEMRTNMEYAIDLLKKVSLEMFLRKNNFDAVLAEYGPTGAACASYCKKKNIPLIVHFHGNDAYSSDIEEELSERYKEMYKTASAIIAVSQDMEKQLIKIGAPEEKLFFNPYGVDLENFSGSAPGKSEPLFVGTGRFVEKKAPYLTILAFEKVLKVVPDARMIIIGDGFLLDVCQKMVKALGIEKAIDLSGKKTHDEVSSLMKNARAFVQHSITPANGDSEGTPLSILEAGASGLPVISTKHAGIKDVIVDGETGFLVEECDVNAMAEYMIQIAKNPELAAKMGKAARQRVCEKYSSKKSIGKLWEIISNTVS